MIIDELKSIVGAKGWIDDPAMMQPYVTEWRDRYKGQAAIVLLPASTAEVASIVRACSRTGTSLVPQGGNTGLCGGAMVDDSGQQVLLSLRRMNAIRRISAEDFSVVADAGCTLTQVQQAADGIGRSFPLSLASEGSCQIGGNLSTNAGGINVLRYGTARQQVLGLEVVLANGEVIHGLRSLRKDTAGYDLKQLFIGSEGTLGIITAACLRLVPAPGEIQTTMFAMDSPDAGVVLLAELRRQLGDALHAFEILPDIALQFVTRHIPGTRSPFASSSPWYAVVSLAADAGRVEEVAAEALQNGLANDAVLANNGAEAEAIWKLRHTISEAQKPEGASLKHDVSVPVASVGKFIDQASHAVASAMPGSRLVAFGHVGDGNVHFNISQPKAADPDEFLARRREIAHLVYDIVAEFEGSFSAEHGIGKARKGYLQSYRSETELALMRTLKNSLDPQGILNPGKVI